MEQYLEQIKTIFDEAYNTLSSNDFIKLVSAVEDELWTQRDRFDEETFIKLSPGKPLL